METILLILKVKVKKKVLIRTNFFKKISEKLTIFTDIFKKMPYPAQSPH